MHCSSRAGFRHSAFTFGCEAMVAKSNISGAKIPPGQLVNFIQKGIMYAELERSIAADGTDHPSTEPCSLLQSPAAEKRGGKGAAGGASSSESQQRKAVPSIWIGKSPGNAANRSNFEKEARRKEVRKDPAGVNPML